jgi:hypothetical protein
VSVLAALESEGKHTEELMVFIDGARNIDLSTTRMLKLSSDRSQQRICGWLSSMANSRGKRVSSGYGWIAHRTIERSAVKSVDECMTTLWEKPCLVHGVASDNQPLAVRE